MLEDYYLNLEEATSDIQHFICATKFGKWKRQGRWLSKRKITEKNDAK